VYAAIASKALDESCRARDGSIGDTTERFKIACAKQGLPYDSGLAQRATDAAEHARQKAEQTFLDSFRRAAHAGRR
jgi:hypothetical protein